ncbi:N-acetyl-gamma-glutamyl-phosphate reductase [Robertkochia sediminum]|uniref:N-acetyl-gamma-glutamyl-phosphate reductase n=1 Tax=Robertkochia sediminum TaxID=2785326 RepID=UPI001931E3FE|nr:N-acetyl-gamma-glutamyl-phosphate reductase [Robertkochia sediminum]MBL7473351.1 N-acetyl-gamma-glutamyl-phosphate reductase [Robertkochia sediminum]
MIKAGIIGGSGYTAGELLRLLVHHPEVNIDFAYSTTNAGKSVSTVHQDLIGDTDLKFTDVVNPDVDVVFLCLGHGNSRTFLEGQEFATHTLTIDLSNDFRLQGQHIANDKTFVYGLPEFFGEEIKQAKAIANPGCFATAIQLALLPMAKAGKLPKEVHTNGITGSTGAGVKPSATTHFSWRNNNISWYKPFTHQHLDEVGQSINTLGDTNSKVIFIPHRGNFTRGIFTTSYFKFEGDLTKAEAIYQKAYENTPFTTLSAVEPHLKQVVNTNKCLVHLHKHEDMLMVTSMIDNLLKGASGQAVQNMNLVFGLEETAGLQLKGSHF